jgi:hypothetical protein
MLNLEAIFQWGFYKDKHISIFLSKHQWITTKNKKPVQASVDVITEILTVPDSAKVKVPPFYIHVTGAPVMTTENELPGL